MHKPRELYWAFLDLIKLYRAKGVVGIRERYANREPLAIFDCVAPHLKHACGLEIGGPTPIFARGKALPVYRLAKRVDNCNYSKHTYWQGEAQEGRSYKFDRWKRPGYQYVLDATNLAPIPSGSYDFVLSSHNIEHIADPIRALKEWIRVLRDAGHLIIVVPHRDGTFDHLRPVTALTHIIADHVNSVNEDDQTHIPEILALHDLGRDPSVTTAQELRELAFNNATWRRMHHHVFDTTLVLKMIDFVGLKVLAATAVEPFHIIVIAQKVQLESRSKNSRFLEPDAEFHYQSPFASDCVAERV